MAETITDKIMEAICSPERRIWLDRENARDMAEDVARALGFQPDEVVDTASTGRHARVVA